MSHAIALKLIELGQRTAQTIVLGTSGADGVNVMEVVSLLRAGTRPLDDQQQCYMGMNTDVLVDFTAFLNLLYALYVSSRAHF